MLEPRRLGRDIIMSIRRRRRALLVFHLYFSLLAFSVLTPAAGWLLTGLLHLTGNPMVGNEALLLFWASPAGLLWLLLSGTLALVLVFVQHAGMMLVASRDNTHHFHSATAALWQVAHRLPRLLQLACLQVGAQLLIAAPFIGLLAGAFVWLLSGYDIYYVINEKPPELWTFSALALLIFIGMLAANGSLYLCWIFALPALLLEGCGPRLALKRSMALTRGVRWRIAIKVVLLGTLLVLLPILVSLIFDLLGGAVINSLPERYGLVIPVMWLLIAGYAIVGIAVTFFGVSANSLLILKLYNRQRQHITELPADPQPRRTGFLAWGVEAVVVMLALGQIAFAVQVLDPRDHVAITAHRGSSVLAPENSLAAIEQAIVDGADYVELDVRETADGELVLLHDRDLLRVAGERRNVWELTYDEIRLMDVGAWFAPSFEGQRIATLGEAIALLRGRAQLYLEIKTSPQTPQLTRRVVELLRQEEFVGQTIVAALNRQVLHDVRRLEPGLRTSLLVHTSIGAIAGTPVDALALRNVLVTPSRVRLLREQGQEVHVWLVNDRRSMSRYIDMGVDNIITDRPDMLAQLLAERAELSDAERLLVRLRHWVW